MNITKMHNALFLVFTLLLGKTLAQRYNVFTCNKNSNLTKIWQRNITQIPGMALSIPLHTA